MTPKSWLVYFVSQSCLLLWMFVVSLQMQIIVAALLAAFGLGMAVGVVLFWCFVIQSEKRLIP